MIDFKELQIGYQQSLAKISISSLEKGKVYALIGSNGSGKSTFLKTICGQIKPFSGQFFIQNKNSTNYSRIQLSRQISFVPARFPDVEFISVFDFVLLGRTPYLNNRGIVSKEDVAYVYAIIERLNITHLAEKFTNSLSDGERQLCAVARALAQQTSIILLDEPSGYLDYKNKRRLIELLLTIAQEMNLLILFSTHDIETIMHYDTIELLGLEVGEQRQIVSIDREIAFEHLIQQFYE
ncbi:MAG: ABC transporter ATP-binding protein [Crocinitomicaceae bacterium]|nr:ABC transporter ATP-binding protein [Crocinitomicaceae bacterium]